ncbi:MAG TPA: ABC transporter permease, partial [Solirubrobacteraceae bacterium]
VLGVAMVCAAYTLTDTMHGAADSLSSSAYDGTAAVVSAKTTFKVSADDQGTAPTVPASTVARVRAVPGVATATGDITDTAKIIGSDGKPVGSGPYFGVGYDPGTPGASRLTPFRLDSGHWAAGPAQVVIDKATADKQHLHVGDTVKVATRGPVRSFEISGITRFGTVESLGTATAAVFSLPAAQKLFDKQGRYDDILVGAKPGVSAPALRDRLSHELGATAKVQSASKQDRFTLNDLKQFLTVIKAFLLAFGFVAIFVGAFTIYTTLSITVAQRSRELAMLRTVGASRRQVLGSVLVEAVAVGLIGSVVGIAVGFGLAHGLQAVLSAFGLDLPRTAMSLAARTVIVALLVGLVVTVLAGLGPAMRATRVSPVIALREGAHVPPGRVGKRATAIGVALSILGLAIIGYGMFAGGLGATDRLISLAPGCLALFLGLALVSPRLARPLASALGRPAERVGGVAGRLARRNAMRNPKRTAVTAAALMVGIALVSFVAVLGQGLKQASTGAVKDSLRASYVAVGRDGWSPIDPASVKSLRAVPGVTTVTSLKQDQARAFGKNLTVDGVQPGSWAKVWRYDWDQGSQSTLRDLGPGQAVVRKSYARKHHIDRGDTVTLTAASGRKLHATVAGVVDVSDLNPVGLGDVTVARAAYDATFPASRDRYQLIAGGSKGAVAHALAAYPDAKVFTAAGWEKNMADQISQLLGVIYVLLALAVIVSLFGIVNTLALAVLERTREVGMLRAVGMTRRQVRRMVRHESIITALMGAVLGIVVGLALGAIVTSSLAKYGLGFAVPTGSLIAFVVVAVVAGTLAAIAPARRAARMDPLGALSYA